ncbi:hypothetical protein JA1_004077 [Spathaspora sp. JA1]|nr:hypothetical protein JA1_004077 [Spathaspora sp. JA1]
MTSTIATAAAPWKLVYDETLQQYYYLNVYENTISFDSPCEVNHKPKRHFSLPSLIKRKSSSSTSYCYANKPSLYRRLSNALSIKSNKSNEQINTTNNSNSTLTETKDDMITGVDDEYFLTNVANFKNFAGTSSIIGSDYSIDSDLEEPLSEDEEIHSYYANIYDDEEETFTDSIDRERELRELRLQMLQELY